MKTNKIWAIVSLLLAIWFAVSGIVWAYFAALVLAYPFGIVSLLLWWGIRRKNITWVHWIPRILLIGLGASFLSFILHLIFA